MNISRGFRRLSVFVAIVGATVMGWLWAIHGAPSVSEFIAAFWLFVLAPAILVLALGWAIDGFRNSN
jgi:hypothetical protein